VDVLIHTTPYNFLTPISGGGYYQAMREGVNFENGACYLSSVEKEDTLLNNSYSLSVGSWNFF